MAGLTHMNINHINLHVVAGVIEDGEGKVLLAKRPQRKHLGGKWEFPGGKVEENETAEQALHRELKEELNLDIEIVQDLGCFPHSDDWGSIDLHVFRVRVLNSPKTSADVQEFQWISPSQVALESLVPADVAPLRAYITQLQCK